MIKNRLVYFECLNFAREHSVAVHLSFQPATEQDLKKYLVGGS